METISNIFELVALFAMAAWFGAPSARTAWARAVTRCDERSLHAENRAPSSDVADDER